MSIYHLDYETRSRADLKKYGAYRYASDVSTSILLAAICKEDGPIEIWDCSATKEENAAARALLQEVSDDANTVIFAHNAPFELAITAYGWKRAFGFKPPEIEQWRCTAALCRTAAIPYSLKDAAEFLGLDEQKDTAGAALIRKFSLPKKDGEWTEPAADKKAWESFREYCRKDVEVERQIHKRLQALDLKGWILDSFQMDLRMNHRGVPINVPGVIEAEKLVKGYNDRMWEEFTNFTGLLPTQTARSLEWFQAEGYPEKDLRSATITKVLTGEIITEEGDATGEIVQPGWSKMTEHGVKALKLRALLSFAALKKLPTMRNAVCPDNRVRGVLMWHGASRTGRHSSRILQVQNMRRPTVKNTERIYAEICSGKIDALDLEVEHGPPLECVASCIRHFIDPGEGKQFIDVDFSQIEARTLAWLAGHKELLQAFHDGKDLYKQTASMTFGVPYEEVDKDLRFLGKVVSLACIAEGELVLTDKGLVKIEEVSCGHKVWDGVEWVHHEGVIYKGTREVITYQGLTATPDHLVFTASQEVLEFGCAASGCIQIAITGDGGTPIRRMDSFRPANAEEKRVSIPFGAMQLWGQGVCIQSKYETGSEYMLRQVLPGQTQIENPEMAPAEITCGQKQVYRYDQPYVASLRRTWNSVLLGINSACRRVGKRQHRSGESKTARQNRQQPWIPTRKSPMGHIRGEQQKQRRSQNPVGLCIQTGGMALCRDESQDVHRARNDQRADSEEGRRGGDQPSKIMAEVPGVVRYERVYDIVNAGPRHRFTVSGVLVHNCGYQGGVNAFTIMAKNYGTEVTEEKAVEVVKAFRANNAPIVNLWKSMQVSAIEAIRNPGRWVAVNSLIRFGLTNALGYPSLVMELPSKRRIQYPKPSIRTVYKFKNQKTGRWDEIPENRALDADGETKEGVWATQEITYAGQMKQSVKWGRVTTHGGVFTENACQAVAGDFLTHGTLNAEKAGYEPCFVVHDQLITNYHHERAETVDGLVSALCQIPEWAPGFPLNAVGGLTDFYTKD